MRISRSFYETGYLKWTLPQNGQAMLLAIIPMAKRKITMAKRKITKAVLWLRNLL